MRRILFLKFFVSILTAAGIYILIGGQQNFPSRRAVKSLAKLTGRHMAYKDRILYFAAHLIEPVIKAFISPYKREQLESKLKLAKISRTPEFHIALALTYSLISLAAAVIILPVLPPVSVLLSIYAVVLFFNKRKVPESDERLQRINVEIPRFTSYVVQSLSHRRDLPGMIQGYREIAGTEFGKELDILITDMRTKNREAALIDFECRINSPLVSELIRGLIGLEHGEDMKAYLTNVEVRMNEYEVAALKKEAAKRPEILMPASWLLFGGIVATYLTVLGVSLFDSLKTFT